MDLFERAVALDDAARAVLLDGVCGEDRELRGQVERLLRSESALGSFLERPIAPAGLEKLDVGATTGSSGGRDVPPPPQLPPESRLGRYRLIRQVGAGGMGVVYEAEQDVPRRIVAIKTLRPDAATRRIRARFHNEVLTLARLRHPRIAQIFDAGTAQTALGEVAYIAMEFVDGPSLTDYAAEKQLSLDARLRMFIELCGAIQHAHQRGVIHRDLKPANILVEKAAAERDALPKVLDFGIARILDVDGRGDSLVTLDGTVLGTLAYMSPEQLGGLSEEVDTRSDVYSLGVVLYELLSGRPPFDVASLSLLEAARQIRERPAPPLGGASRVAGGDLQLIVSKALSKDKAQRYESAAALADDLQRFLDHQPIAARPPTLFYVARRFARRNSLAVLAGGLVCLALLVGAIGTSYGLWRAASESSARAELLESATRSLSAISSIVVKDLEDVAGTSPARRSLVDALRPHADELWRLGGEDPRLLESRADLLDAIASLELENEQFATAATLRDQVLEIAARLHAAAPHDPRRALRHSLSLVRVGDMHKQVRRFDEADRYYLRALEVQSEAQRRAPDDKDLLEALVWSHIRLVHQYAATGRAAQARPLVDCALRLAEQFATSGAGRAAALDALQGAIDAQSAIFSPDDPSKDLHCARRRAVLARELLSVSDSPHHRRTVCYALIGLASLELQHQQCDAALQVADEVAVIAEWRVSHEPHNPLAVLDLNHADTTRFFVAIKREQFELARQIVRREYERTLPVFRTQPLRALDDMIGVLRQYIVLAEATYDLPMLLDAVRQMAALTE